ncbi:hypothetical protein FOZ62_020550, partial [Perkinsus olseni]
MSTIRPDLSNSLPCLAATTVPGKNEKQQQNTLEGCQPPPADESSPTSSAPVGAAAAAASNSNRPSGGRIPVLFLLSVDNVGRLIGKQGRIINQIREAWPGASLVVHESETPAALHSQRERIVAVRPNLADDNDAIRDDMKSRNVEMMLAGICRRLCLPEEDFDPQRVEREIFRADSKVSSDTCCICLLIPGKLHQRPLASPTAES